MMPRILACALSLSAVSLSAVSFANDFFHFNGGFSSAVFDMSPDGQTAVGVFEGSVFRWTAAGGSVLISQPDWQNTFTAGVSADGNTIVSTMLNPLTHNQEGAVWRSGSGWSFVGGLPGGGVDNHLSSAYDVSGDGSKIVGLAWHTTYRAEAFQWTEGGGVVGLGKPSSASSRASAISKDGSTVVGFYENDVTGERRAVRWTNGGAPDLFLGESAVGEAVGVSGDGTFIVGCDFDFNTNISTAFVHSAGVTTMLGILPEHATNFMPRSIANGVSDTGVVVGYSGGSPFWGDAEEGFVWTQAGGMVSISDYLAANGVALPGNLLLNSVTSISANGLTMGGQAVNLDTFQYESWIATVPEPSTLCALGLAGLLLRRRARR